MNKKQCLSRVLSPSWNLTSYLLSGMDIDEFKELFAPIEKTIARLKDIPTKAVPGVFYVAWKATPLKGVQKLLISHRRLDGDLIIDGSIRRVPANVYPDKDRADARCKILADRYTAKQKEKPPSIDKTSLSAREFEILKLKQQGIKSNIEIGERLSISAERVRQIYAKAKRKLARLENVEDENL